MSALPLVSAAQSECKDYHKFNCAPATDSRFSVNGQSRSASVQVGVPTELNIIVYKGQDYRISFCYDQKVLGDHIVARLIEKTREPKQAEGTDVLNADGNPGTTEVKGGKKTVYEETRKVLWDNQEHEMTDAVEFTATATKRIAVEVMAPGAEDNGKAKRSDKPYDIGCVGILIEHMPTPNIGF
ncbi:MAG: hypothetical protein QM724_08850 [Flavobacteriales bacterium]